MKQEIIFIDLGGTNSYLVKSEEGFLLVDTGGHITMDKVFTNRLDKLKEELDKAGVNKENLKLIILTHGHSDHVANAAYLRKLYHAKIAMYPLDVEQVEKLDMDIMMSSFKYQSIALTIKIRNLNVVNLYPGHGKPFNAEEVFHVKNK